MQRKQAWSFAQLWHCWSFWAWWPSLWRALEGIFGVESSNPIAFSCPLGQKPIIFFVFFWIIFLIWYNLFYWFYHLCTVSVLPFWIAGTRCHHKGGAGSLARWLKLELGRRSKMKVFIDSDNLTDLTQLFTIVSEDVQTLVIVASPGVLTRKWCIGEMVAARLKNVDAVLLSLPSFALPDQHFLNSFEGLIPGVQELASYGFGSNEIMDTLQWLRTIREICLESITLTSFNDVVGELVNARIAFQNERERTGSSSTINSSNCPVLPDPEDTEAVATAHILCTLIGSDMMRAYGALPKVLNAKEPLCEEQQPTELFVVMICSKDCLVSFQIATWLLEALDISEEGSVSGSPSAAPLKQVFVLPLVAEDFQVPSTNHFDKVAEHPNLLHVDVQRYVNILQAVFFQIALPFAPKVSSEGDLSLKANRIAARLRSDRMGSLQSNYAVVMASCRWNHPRTLAINNAITTHPSYVSFWTCLFFMIFRCFQLFVFHMIDSERKVISCAIPLQASTCIWRSRTPWHMNCVVNPQRRWRNVPSKSSNSDEGWKSESFSWFLSLCSASSLTGLSEFCVRSEPALWQHRRVSLFELGQEVLTQKWHIFETC